MSSFEEKKIEKERNYGKCIFGDTSTTIGKRGWL